jgi:hypothetical protein
VTPPAVDDPVRTSPAKPVDPDAEDGAADGAAGLSPRVLNAAALVCLLLVAARVTIRAAQPLDNADTWFHLRIGHELWGPWTLSHPGGLSRFATVPWVPTQWSTELAMAKVEDWFGLPGLAWVFGALYVALVVVLYAVCRARSAPPAAAVAAGLAVIGCAPALSARPQLVSLLMLAVVVTAWLRASRTHRAPWLLVPLTWFWATAHGLWSAGVLVGVVCCVGMLADRALDRDQALRMGAVPLLSVVAACLTPVGPRLLGTQVAVAQRSSMIAEWQATSFRDLSALVVALMILTVMVCWARRGQGSWVPLGLVVLAGGWAALSQRMVGPAAVVTAPLLAVVLQDLLDPRLTRRRPGRGEVAVISAGVATCLAVLAVAVPSTAARPANVPSGFASRLAGLPDGSAVVVADGSGSWIEWRFPRLDPTIDGMLDAYPVDYIRGFADLQAVDPGWRGFVDRSGARDAIVPAASPAAAALRERLHWRVASRDGRWLYLVAPAPRPDR